MERGSTLSLEEKVTPTFHRHATLSGLFAIFLLLSACLFVFLSVCPKCCGPYLTQEAALSWISPSNGRAGGTTTGC